MKARYAHDTRADKARELLSTAHALLVCWVSSLPAEGPLEARHASPWQTAMRGLGELMDDAASAYSEAHGVAGEAGLAAMYAQGIVHCIEGTLWALVAEDLPGPLAVPELATAARYVQRLVQQAIEALPAAAVQGAALKAGEA